MENENNAASSREDSEETPDEANFSISEELARNLWQVPLSADIADDDRLSDKALRLYIKLLGYARSKTTCFPSRETLSRAVHCTVRYVDTLKAALKEIGLLDWEHRIFKDGRLHNYYTLLKYKPIKGKKLSDRGNADLPNGEMQDSPPENCRTPDQGSAVPRNNTHIKNTDRKDRKKEEEERPAPSSSEGSFSTEEKSRIKKLLNSYGKASGTDKEVVRKNWEKVEELASLEVTQKEIAVAWNELDKEQLQSNPGWMPRVGRGLSSLLSPKNDGIYQLLVNNLWSQKISSAFPKLDQETDPSLSDFFTRTVKSVYDFDTYWARVPGKVRYQYACDFYPWRENYIIEEKARRAEQQEKEEEYRIKREKYWEETRRAREEEQRLRKLQEEEEAKRVKEKISFGEYREKALKHEEKPEVLWKRYDIDASPEAIREWFGGLSEDEQWKYRYYIKSKEEKELAKRALPDLFSSQCTTY